MKLADSLKLSINSILHRKLRAWLTLLGVIIGVAAVVSIVSIGEGATASVNASLASLGADIITITPGASSSSFFGGSFRGGRSGSAFNQQSNNTSLNSNAPELTDKDVRTIQSNPNILQVNEIASGRGELVFLAEKTNVNIQGVNPNTWQVISNLELSSGRFLTASDSTAIVIGNRLANDSFKQPLTLGRQIVIENKAFTITGILKPSVSGFGGGGGDSTVYMHVKTAWTVLEDVNKDTYTSIQAKVNDAENIESIQGDLESSLLLSRRVTDRTKDFSISSLAATQDRLNETTATLTLFLGAIAAVSLVVGAIGIANSMFTSVLEKTHEIGILKALGSTNFEILRLFIIESGLFGLIGGLFGVGLGMLASAGISSLGVRLIGPGGQVSTLVTPDLIMFSVVLSTLIGIVSGITPALSASKLKPIEALRYE